MGDGALKPGCASCVQRPGVVISLQSLVFPVCKMGLVGTLQSCPDGSTCVVTEVECPWLGRQLLSHLGMPLVSRPALGLSVRDGYSDVLGLPEPGSAPPCSLDSGNQKTWGAGRGPLAFDLRGLGAQGKQPLFCLKFSL